MSEKELKTPFNMIISGMTGCGKTFYLLNMLEKEYFGHFEYIFLICPTYGRNKTYQEWKHKDCKYFFAIQPNQNVIEKWLKFLAEKFENTNSLIILDDCASSQSVKNRVSELVSLGFSARHLGLSTIVITQQLTSIAKPYRENIQKLVMFYNPSKKSMKAITDDFLNIGNDDINDVTEKLRNNKYARLEVMLDSPPYTHKVVIPPSIINE